MRSLCRAGVRGVGFASLLLMAACGASDEPTATQARACEILGGVAATSVMAEPYMGGPGPVVMASDARFVVALPPSVGGPTNANAGHVQWAVATAGVYGLFVGENMTLIVRNAAGELQPFAKRLGSASGCEAIRFQVTLAVQPGIYSIELGPTPFPSVRLAILPTVDEEGI